MLTGPLVLARVRGATIEPGRIDPDKPALRAAAEDLHATFTEAVAEGRTRGALQEEVDDLCAERRDHKILRGLAKLCFDRSEFAVEASMDPAALRAEAFRLAAERGPLALDRGPLGRPIAEDILAEIGEARGLSVEALQGSLYADLKEAQRILSFEIPDPTWLLHRFNVAQIQALLLRSTEVTLRLSAPPAPRMRQLFRYIKFHQLIHRARRDGDTLELVLDGPSSLFAQSTRYGMQLARFFPALLHLQTPWSMQATVLWTKARYRKTLTLSHDTPLVGHYVDRGGYRTREQEWFQQRFEALGSEWALREGDRPLNLADHAVIFPDFSFHRGGKTAHLEILGFWRREDLGRRLELLASYGPGNLVLAVSRRLKGSKEAWSGESPVPIIPFAEVVPAKEVLAAVEQVAR